MSRIPFPRNNARHIVSARVHEDAEMDRRVQASIELIRTNGRTWPLGGLLSPDGKTLSLALRASLQSTNIQIPDAVCEASENATSGSDVEEDISKRERSGFRRGAERSQSFQSRVQDTARSDSEGVHYATQELLR